MEIRGTPKSQNNPKKSKVGGLTCSQFTAKLQPSRHSATGIRTGIQINGIELENPEIKPHFYIHQFSTTMPKQSNEETMVFSTNG